MSRKLMSMEAVMDEERREVLALLNNRVEQTKRSSSVASMNRSATRSATNSRSASPFTTRSPIRSMLDYVDDDLEAPPPSPGSTNRSLRPGASKPVRSMLDIDCPSPSPALSPLTHVFSAQNSPTEPSHGSTGHPRSMSDASSKPAEFGPRPSYAKSDRADPTAGYQFSDIITNRENPLPRRALQNSSPAVGSMYRNNAVAELIRNAEIGGLILPGGQGSLHGRAMSGNKHKSTSKSPHNRLSARSMSPATAFGGRGLSPAGRAFLAEEGLDMSNAYRRLSDANLIRSGGSLSSLPMRKRKDSEAKIGRLAKDYLSPDGEELADTSEDEANSTSDEDEASRGRKAARSFPDDNKAKPKGPLGSNSNGHQPRSLLAAAEEERVQVASSRNYQYRSLLDEPEILVTNPSGEKVKSTKNGIHPANSFDAPSRSASRTPWDSDDEADYTDIKNAQKLSFTMTPIISTPEVERCIRIIYRGDFDKIQKDVTEEEHRRLRKYLVATDLSEESTHALEWTVGTVLRDGDTLVAVYCVDEETGIPDGQEEPKAGRDGTSTPSSGVKMVGITSLSNLATIASASNAGGVAGSRPSLLMKHSDASNMTRVSSSPGPQTRSQQVQERSKAEEERKRAVQDITDRITKLLRKTRLQVRVIVEVLHCKNPRHLLTEVIDLLNPTLVILGSRGRSALKGVILGSFSNYLVTKSSAPVMVARKRLRKQGQYRRTSMNQVNNLSNPTARSLASAKID